MNPVPSVFASFAAPCLSETFANPSTHLSRDRTHNWSRPSNFRCLLRLSCGLQLSGRLLSSLRIQCLGSTKLSSECGWRIFPDFHGDHVQEVDLRRCRKRLGRSFGNAYCRTMDIGLLRSKDQSEKQDCEGACCGREQRLRRLYLYCSRF